MGKQRARDRHRASSDHDHNECLKEEQEVDARFNDILYFQRMPDVPEGTPEGSKFYCVLAASSTHVDIISGFFEGPQEGLTAIILELLQSKKLTGNSWAFELLSDGSEDGVFRAAIPQRGPVMNDARGPVYDFAVVDVEMHRAYNLLQTV